jgi:hypothetical protein
MFVRVKKTANRMPRSDGANAGSPRDREERTSVINHVAMRVGANQFQEAKDECSRFPCTINAEDVG